MTTSQLTCIFVFIVWNVQPLKIDFAANSTSVLKTRKLIYLNEMLIDWSKKC